MTAGINTSGPSVLCPSSPVDVFSNAETQTLNGASVKCMGGVGNRVPHVWPDPVQIPDVICSQLWEGIKAKAVLCDHPGIFAHPWAQVRFSALIKLSPIWADVSPWSTCSHVFLTQSSSRLEYHPHSVQRAFQFSTDSCLPRPFYQWLTLGSGCPLLCFPTEYLPLQLFPT